MKEKYKHALRISLSVILILLGVVIAFLAYGATTPVGIIGGSIGISLTVTGFVSAFQETVLNPLRRDEIQEGFDKIKDLIIGPGIRVVTPERRGYPGYHRWLLETASQNIFFAGHSVLHRVEADFESLGLLSVENALKQKISEGSKIRILFLDPTWDFIERIAKSQEQDPKELLKDLATTIGITKKLWGLLENENLPGFIEIRTCRELTHYAFHFVDCRERNETNLLIGFYFAGRLGTISPLFVVEHAVAREFFHAHFTTVFERSTRLLRYSREGIKNFNLSYYRECQEAFSVHFEPDILSKLCP